MKIEQLTLERYGAFSDRTIRFDPEARLHVVLGANEAGKTSALSAISDLLFGFEPRTSYGFHHGMPALRVGGVFRQRDGSVIEARRRKGNKNTLSDANDQALPDDFLNGMLGGITREIFTNEFGLTAGELRAGGHEMLKAGGRLAETLAASSAGLTALTDLRGRLVEEAKLLFTPTKAASRAFYVASTAYSDANRRLRDAIVTPDATKAAEAAVATAQAQSDALDHAFTAANSNLVKFRRAMRVRSKLARLDALVADRAAAAHLPEANDRTIAAWRAAVADHARLQDELARLDRADVIDADAIAALKVDEALLVRAATIDALDKRSAWIEKSHEDLPRRSEAQRTAQQALQEAARHLGLSQYQELLSLLPTNPALAEVKDLIERARQAEATQAQAQARHQRAAQEYDRINAESEASAHTADPEPLRQRLKALDDIPKLADRQRHAQAAFDREQRDLTMTVAALLPGVDSLDHLIGMVLPDDAAVAEHDRAAAKLAGDLAQAKLRVASAARAVEAAQDELAKFSRAGSIATAEDLAAARAARDDSFDVLAQALDDADISVRRVRLQDARSLTLASDRVADQINVDSDRSAKHSALQARINDAARELERARAEQAELVAQGTDAEASWLQLWGPAGITPHGPADMVKWRARVGDILKRAGKHAEQRAALASDAAQLDGLRAALVSLFNALGRTADPAVPVDALYRESAERVSEMQTHWSDARVARGSLALAKRDLTEAEAALASARELVARCYHALPAAMVQIGLAGDASLARGEEALKVWQGVPVGKQAYERESRSVDGINTDLAAFAADVAALTGDVAKDLADQSPQDALQALATRLASARSAYGARAQKRDAVALRQADRLALQAQCEPVVATLAQARQQLSLAPDDDLADMLDQLTRRNALVAAHAVALHELPVIADGLDEATLRAEQAGLEFDELPGQIEQLEVGQKQRLAENNAAHAAVRDAERARDELFKGRDAGGAAHERAEAASELLDVAERWLVRAAAVKLADRAVERHRAIVQDPMLARAGELFRLSTAGAFSGLRLDYGDDDNPVVKAVRSSQDKPIDIAGLSEGSRDQLFLALRLALLERRTAESLPFIGDDLLASFDEMRTASTLALLADAGAKRQMILFTHHRHVADISQSLPGQDIAVIEL